MFCLAICDDDTLHMQNTLRCAGETPEAADCDIRTFSAPGELMDAVTGGGYRPHIALLDICMPDSSGIELAQRLHEKLPLLPGDLRQQLSGLCHVGIRRGALYFILKSQMAQRLGPPCGGLWTPWHRPRRPAAGAGRASYRVPVSEVLYAERVLWKTRVVTTRETFMTQRTPAQLLEESRGFHPLPPELLGEPVPGPVHQGRGLCHGKRRLRPHQPHLSASRPGGVFPLPGGWRK